MNEEKRMKASANYALEMFGEKSAEGQAVWLEVQDGFVSPEKAIEFAGKQKLQGAFRVVRVASPIYAGSVVTPEPVYTLAKIANERGEKIVRAKAGRKPRLPKVVPAVPVTADGTIIADAIPEDQPPEEAIPLEDEGMNPGEALDAADTP